MEGDDQCSCVSEPQGMDTLQGQGTVKPLHQGSTMQGQGTSELTPVYVLKNVVLKKVSNKVEDSIVWQNKNTMIHLIPVLLSPRGYHIKVLFKL